MSRDEWVKKFLKEILECPEEELEVLINKIIDYGFCLAVSGD